MSQTQQEAVPSPDFPIAKPSAPATEPEVGSWEPYLSLMSNWQRADEICAKAISRAQSTGRDEENRVLSTFELDKAKLESSRRDRLGNIETERQSNRESADRLLAQAQTTHTRVRQAMETVGLETLMDDIEVSSSFKRDDATSTLSSLRDTVASSLTLENSLQNDLFDLRAARQRQSAQMWTVGIGLWIVAVLAFAPYISISVFLVAMAAFVIATPRKIETSEDLRPSFWEHIGHCLALLVGKQQVMQHPFSLVEKGRDISGNALGGSLATAGIAWVFFYMLGTPAGYNPAELLKHLALVSVSSIIAGAISFSVTNYELTFPEIMEGEKNKILK